MGVKWISTLTGTNNLILIDDTQQDLTFSALGARLLALGSNDKESVDIKEFVPSPTKEVLVEL